ncbi:hypothetical protein B296_00049880 [Ensete ventricosum]|uniref:Uncharacterized protein n=1 Tax=Ensete ventricosum TaxID=4639 RepID=A0A426YHX2_ENSVE|nr:hypothetical protein B296_00049880 [Ensete ventricosum]
MARRRAVRLSEMSAAGEPWDGNTDENLTRRRLFRSGPLLVAVASSKATRKRGKHQRLLINFPKKREKKKREKKNLETALHFACIIRHSWVKNRLRNLSLTGDFFSRG